MDKFIQQARICGKFANKFVKNQCPFDDKRPQMITGFKTAVSKNFRQFREFHWKFVAKTKRDKFAHHYK